MAGGARRTAKELEEWARWEDSRKMAALVALGGGGRQRAAEETAAVRMWARELLAKRQRRPQRQVPVVTKRAVRNELIGLGMLPDGRGRWAVEAVIAWRGEGLRNREALVRFAGVDLQTGLPEAPRWIAKAWLTEDLRRLDELSGRRRRDTAGDVEGRQAAGSARQGGVAGQRASKRRRRSGSRLGGWCATESVQSQEQDQRHEHG